MMSISNLSTIGFLEDEEDDDFSFMYVRQAPHVSNVYKTNRFLKVTSAKSLCAPHVPYSSQSDCIFIRKDTSSSQVFIRTVFIMGTTPYLYTEKIH